MNTVEENKIAVDAIADALADRFTDTNYAEKELAIILVELVFLTEMVRRTSNLAPAVLGEFAGGSVVNVCNTVLESLDGIIDPARRAELVKMVKDNDKTKGKTNGN